MIKAFHVTRTLTPEVGCVAFYWDRRNRHERDCRVVA